MIYPFHITYNNMFHYTTESILPVLDYRSAMKPGDEVILPNFSHYPVELVKRMIPEGVSVTVTDAFVPKKFLSCYLAAAGAGVVRPLCDQMLTYVEKKPIPPGKPVIFMSFRLHKRRWLPLDNIQNLVNHLKDKYTILLSLNPVCEKITNIPSILNVIPIYDLSYEEQLSYAATADYAIFGNGAGMIFPRIVGMPSIMITPCLITETSGLGLYYGDNVVSLSDKRTDTNACWNFDVEKVSVDEVLETFYNYIETPEA